MKRNIKHIKLLLTDTRDLSILEFSGVTCLLALLFGALLLIMFSVTTAVGIYKTQHTTVPATIIDTVYVAQDNYEHLQYSYLFNRMKIKNKQAFIYAVKSLGAKKGIPYRDILGVFNVESIGVNPKAHNPRGAHGLWQITGVCAKQLNIGKEELLRSDEYQQLIWFEEYLDFWGVDKINNYGDLYCIVFIPSLVKRDHAAIPEWVLEANPFYRKCKTVGQFKLCVTERYNRS